MRAEYFMMLHSQRDTKLEKKSEKKKTAVGSNVPGSTAEYGEIWDGDYKGCS